MHRLTVESLPPGGYSSGTQNALKWTTSAPIGQVIPFSEFSSAHKGHDEIASILCILGQTYVLGINGNPICILQKHLTSLAQMWSAFSYNLSPNTHTSDLNLERVELNEPTPIPRAPHPPRAATSSHSTHDPSSTFEVSFQETMTKMFARQEEDLWLGHQAIRQGQVNIMDRMH
ncbi:hypothetical protein DEO72_LG8g1651 [Vigna unguiculata]|uniref:Uncharacterized protein n=1 Tax=Vigna unguiculata TaxID=3917 RepID=A0A4D6MQ66_VIGUN|nr:hypothetical protein DEO72_LG8g1651 [Vigna unguiculata]